MEWKIIVGQICLTAITITCVLTKTDTGIVWGAMGALAASIGYPVVLAAKEAAAA